MPVITEVGISTQPEVQVLPVHALWQPQHVTI